MFFFCLEMMKTELRATIWGGRFVSWQELGGQPGLFFTESRTLLPWDRGIDVSAMDWLSKMVEHWRVVLDV